MNRRRKTPLAAQKHRCDALWSEIIRSIGRCQRCGETHYQLNAHHLIPRTRLATRWAIANGICLCVMCHKIGRDAAHEDPLGFAEWFAAAQPKWMDWWREHKHSTARMPMDEVESQLKQAHAAVVKNDCAPEQTL